MSNGPDDPPEGGAAPLPPTPPGWRWAGAPPPWWPRWRRRLLLGLAGLGLLWALAHAVADRQEVRDRIHRRAADLLARRLPAARLGDQVSVDWLFRASLGPLTVPAVAAGAPPVLEVDLLKVRLAWWPLLSGRFEPASVRLYGVRLSPGPGGAELERLAKALRRPQSPAGAAAPRPRGADPVVHVRDLTVALELAGRTLPLGPVDLRLERRREQAEEALSLELRLEGGGHAEATLRRPSGGEAADEPAWTLSASWHATAADLPATLRGRAVAATAGTLTGSLEASGAAGLATATLRGRLAGLQVAGRALGPEPVGPFDVTGEAELTLSKREPQVRLRRALLRPAGPLALEATGALTTRGDLPFELSLTLPPVDYRALVAALPPALAPGPDAPQPPGAFGGSLALSGALRRPEGWAVRAEVDLSGLKEAARTAPPSPLRAPFTAHPEGPDGPAVLIGPANPDFVPLSTLPEHVVRAVTTSEDAGFWGHRGFDFDELKNALAAGAKAGKLLRGGSTISQQLAKNLFLSRDRTLTRKLREALVTVALEGTVPKARLLEIYLNLIEWGPGLHGLGAASRHYLGKEARDLTPREACFLAALIPSPLRGHAAVAAGVPAERWATRVDGLLQKLNAAGVLDDEALLEALAAPITFAAWVPRRAAPPEAAPPDAEEGEEGDEPDPVTPSGEAPRAPERGPEPSAAEPRPAIAPPAAGSGPGPEPSGG